MADRPRIRIGLAGWSNPPAKRLERESGDTHLSFYAAHFGCVEINSSFYRAHQRRTYARWRDETPASFRFSVKMPRSITHESGLKRCTRELAGFYDDIRALQPKLTVVLVQLPPSLEFERRTVRAFFKSVPQLRGVRLVCEPRHSSWFTAAADGVLRDGAVARVAADPVRIPGAENPGGAPRFAYFRWHGAPRMYYSSYSRTQLLALAAAMQAAAARGTWCIFDNTARHAAWGDALRFEALLGR